MATMPPGRSAKLRAVVGHVCAFAIGSDGEGGQVAIVIQEEMELHGPLALAEVGPGKEPQAGVDDGGVQAEEAVPETEAALLAGTLESGLRPILALSGRGAGPPIMSRGPARGGAALSRALRLPSGLHVGTWSGRRRAHQAPREPCTRG